MSGFVLKNVDEKKKKKIFALVDKIHKEMRTKELSPSIYIYWLDCFSKSNFYSFPYSAEIEKMNGEHAEKITKLEDFIFLGIENNQFAPDFFLVSLRNFYRDIKKITISQKES